ncbi:MAG TPA: protein kinase [Pyrinomonadaceae bacterium]|jgi:Flp pilus assembly protein TadD/TolB-like protein/predicted Ser/Thr protein kinase
MRAEDWPRVEELFHEALALGGAERDAYLARACGGDAGLRGEVESLVAAFESERSFIERPALSLGMRVLSEGAAASLVGGTVGRYRVVSPLGRGGMGEVYLAEDSVLERRVALKFISGGVVGDEWAREQLTQEARAVARLEHPNICAVYGFEEDGGRHFIVMQYVEGETLASLLRAGRPGAGLAFGLAEQIASALAAAHAGGVVHRDVKPQNIIVTAEGQAKVLDFGLAKFVRPKRQGEGAGEPGVTARAEPVVGTIAYMSPEQARGEALDARSDIFSFGIVLHELFCGANPFARDDAADSLEAVKAAALPPGAGRAPGAPAGLRRVLLKCLAKERARRYQTADELLRDLRGLRRAQALARYALPALALFMLLAACAGFVYLRYNRAHTLAVMPVANESGDPEMEPLSAGLTESLVGRLSHLDRLRVRAPKLISREQAADPMRLGRALGAEAVLVNRIVGRGGPPQLQTALVSVRDGSPLWEETSPVDLSEIQATQDRVALGAAAGLRMWLREGERRLLTRHETDNTEALRMHMRGQYLWDMRDKEKLRSAIEMFERATALDPAYAQAWAGLAYSYVFQTNVAYGPKPPEEVINKARAALNKALQSDNMLCEAHTALGVLQLRHEWNWSEAEKEFRLAIKLNREYAPAHYWYSSLLRLLGRSEEAIRESETYKTLEPFAPLATVNLAISHYRARDYDRSAVYLKQVLDEDPNNRNALYIMGLVHVKKGAYPEAVATLERLYELDQVLAAAPLGYAYARNGRTSDAMRVLAMLEAVPPDKPIPAQEKAIIYMGLRDNDKAFTYLEQAYRERFASLTSLTTEPFFDDLHSDPRYHDLARRIGLTP